MSLSPLRCFSTTTVLSIGKNPVALYINRKNNPENAKAKSREKEKIALLSYVIIYVTSQRNSSKKLDSLDQSGLFIMS